MIRAGLRARVTAGFAAGAFTLSTVMAFMSYQLIRGSLLEDRERAAVRAAYYNAAVVDAGLAADRADVVEVLRSLDSGGNRRAVLRRDGTWYARSADTGITTAIPGRMRELVEGDRPALQRIDLDGQPAVVVGVPLTGSVSFYSVESLGELDRTLRLLALVLTAVAVMTAAGGALLGRYATRYVLRPVESVTEAARDIAAGDLSARLDPAAEPDLARLTTSFNQMVDQLARRLEQDRRFAADVSHELRSPLQTLAAAASILARRRDRLDERSAAAAGLVTDEITRFQHLVNDLLELARADQPACRGPVDVVDLAHRVCRRRGLPDELVRTDGDVGVWWIDKRRVEQALGNLLDNALGHGGGPVAVRLGRTNGVCHIEVDDEGTGVDPQDREAIFERFVRGRMAGARGDTGGTGLGLALVAQHAAAHGGRALVCDRPGGGARFRIELTGCAP